MSKLIRFQPLTALAITGLTVMTLTTGCGEDNPLGAVQDGLCCTQFKVGADLSGADFGLEGQIDGQFKALAQAGSDLAIVANGALLDVSVACENLARDMGADTAAVDAAVAKGGDGGVKDVCNLATAAIKAKFGASGTIKGAFEVDFQPPVCTASVNAQASCEGGCSVEGKCDASAKPPTCEGGKLTVECKGGCEAEAGVDVSCTGSCTGECSGSCTAEAGATVDCDGTCEGTCTVDGTANSASGVQADGTCKGKCEGKCTAKAGVKAECSGTCEGSCSAKCEAKAGVKFTCDAECDGEFEAPKCEGGELKIDCDVDAECKANCSASASAKAECQPPSLAVTFAATGTVDVDAQVEIDAAIASIRANLPNLLVVLKARGAAFVAGVEASAKAGGKIAANPGDLSGEAALCLLPIAGALTEASTNFKASFDASVSVAGAVGVK